MLRQTQVDEVRRLLASGLSQRKVALLTQVSRATVGAIASGRRPDYPPRLSEPVDDGPLPRGELVWCTGCGHHVYLVNGRCKWCADQGRTPRYLPPRRFAARDAADPRLAPAPLDGLASPVDLLRQPEHVF